ncbi:potassium voltage-gated channel subfamily A member 2-like [Hydractinia symbiolongicarpus]|uniref:potassium voltage-gated channel subfamily A member 2-like n=1 Tax=Hydractinia symbiolongicarpus TaxID=13093 RepID=UPI00255060C0|nr:potassium voltage-gated channel subfamily A member 2-like [Hydractinia symbiolongicarpus]
MEQFKTRLDQPQEARISINVSGVLFETFERTLQQYPETLLGNHVKREKFYCSRTNQYFFNRHRLCFDAILFFYQSPGKLYRPSDVKLHVFEAECKFFELPSENIYVMKTKEGAVCSDNFNEKLYTTQIQRDSFRQKVWDILENPESSGFARNFAILSLFLIFTSIITAIMDTVEEYAKQNGSTSSSNPAIILEIFLNTFFLLEFIGRALFSPNKKMFFRSSLNIIDALVVISFFTSFCLSRDAHSSPGFFRVLRVLRIFRLLRLSKHSLRMKAIGLIMQDSLKDLQLFFVCLLIIVTFGASIMYYVEQTDEHTQFTSIPQSMWWGVQTFLTLGYGDIVPRTIVGKVFSSMYMVFGVATISLPVLSLVMKFTQYYSLHQGY